MEWNILQFSAQGGKKIRGCIVVGPEISRLSRIAVFVIITFGLIIKSAFAIDGPSFDCSNGVRQSLAAILCTFPKASAADWDYNNAFWALSPPDDKEQTIFSQNITRRCALPPLETSQEQAGRLFLKGFGESVFGGQFAITGPSQITAKHVNCVIDAFQQQTTLIRSKLRGDALTESNLSPEEHMEVQQSLLRKGVLQNKRPGYGTRADGQFGPNTRSAISQYQRSLNVPATGFLSDEQRAALNETPEIRAQRDARIAAKEKSDREQAEAAQLAEKRANEAAIQLENTRRAAEAAKKQAEEERQKETIGLERKRLEYAKLADERAKQATIELESERRAAEVAKKQADEEKRQAAIDLQKKALEAAAAKASEWRGKIEEAQKKGVEYAQANDLKWTLNEKINPMTDEQEYEVVSIQTNDTGAKAVIRGYCATGQIIFEAVLHDSTDMKIPLGLPGMIQGGVIGKKRINDNIVFATNFPIDKFRNRIILAQQSFEQDASEAADTAWRVLAELETSQGTLYIKVAMFDSKIQKLVAACKRQYAISNVR